MIFNIDERDAIVVAEQIKQAIMIAFDIVANITLLDVRNVIDEYVQNILQEAE